MILIADSHVSAADTGKVDEFFRMLDRLAATTEDVVFLGDILDLWLAAAPCETDLHLRLAAWCREQKKRRVVGFIEGNHEFFLRRRRGGDFSFCASGWWRDDRGRVFCHGDVIDSRDWGHLLFRALTRNALSGLLLRRLPGAPALANRIKGWMAAHTKYAPKFIPEERLRAFAEHHFSRGARVVFCGHFHRFFEYRSASGGMCYVIPPWADDGQVAVWDEDSRDLRVVPWHSL